MSKLTKWLNRLREKASARGYTCDICGAELFDYPTHRICQECDGLFVKNDGKTCPKCGRAVVTDGACLACKSNLPSFTAAFSAFPYEGLAAQTLNGFKNGKRYLSWYFGEALCKTLIDKLSLSEMQQTQWLLLPVPLTEKRQKERGYNQAEELAISLHRALQNAGIVCTLDTQTLLKRRDEYMQKHLSAAERFKNAEGAYHVHKRKFCKGKSILLVDDLLTTGATGNACAKLLLGAGAKCVYLCTVAATPEQK